LGSTDSSEVLTTNYRSVQDYTYSPIVWRDFALPGTLLSDQNEEPAVCAFLALLFLFATVVYTLLGTEDLFFLNIGYIFGLCIFPSLLSLALIFFPYLGVIANTFTTLHLST
jgi:hypothetical protein